jgi:pimeloyl-ACP methyl ester carboxylesterase
MSARLAPLLFGTAPTLHGMLSTPDEASLRGRGVVLCAPFGYQNLCTYRPLRTLAERLAESGWPVLRFDWPGSGDSGDREPGAAPDGASWWTGAIREAAAALRSSTGVEQIVLAGIGIGATLAACAGLEQEVSGLLLLSPHVSGSGYLREVRAFEGMAARGGVDADGASDERGLEASGFILTEAEAAALSSVDLSSLDQAVTVPPHVLVATPQRDRAGGLLADGFATAGADVQQAILPELAAVFDEPHLGALPPVCSRVVLDWLDALPPAPPPGLATRAAGGAVLTAGGVREETIALDGPRGALVGVTAEPAGDEPACNAWLVLLNAGGIRRSGPARLWTGFARAWAGRGLRSLRLDLSGIGDSVGSTSEDEVPSQEVGRLYVTDFSDDVHVALRWIESRGDAPHVALLGLCSGAYWSLHTALSESSAVGTVVLVNPAVLFWDEHVPSVRALGLARRVIRNPTRWHRVLGRGARVHGRNLVKGAVLKARGRVDEGWHARSIRAALERLAETGVATLMVFSERDAGLVYLEQHLGPGYRAELEQHGVTVEVIPGADHIFRPRATHALLRAAVERHLERNGLLQPVQDAALRAP